MTFYVYDHRLIAPGRSEKRGLVNQYSLHDCQSRWSTFPSSLIIRCWLGLIIGNSLQDVHIHLSSWTLSKRNRLSDVNKIKLPKDVCINIIAILRIHTSPLNINFIVDMSLTSFFIHRETTALLSQFLIFSFFI